MLNIEKPTLIINKDIVLSNIKTSKELSEKLSISFRPHLKLISLWRLEHGLKNWGLKK